MTNFLDPSYLKQLTDSEKVVISKKIQQFDIQLLKNTLKEHSQQAPFVPYTDYGYPLKAGEQFISKMGCLLLAGGQGTRLGFNGPKGMYPIIPHKTIFQILAERAKVYGDDVFLAIMTSTENDKATRAYWQQQNYFGLKQVSFFCQPNLPFLNDNGYLFLDSPNHLATGPDGNGSALKEFCASGIWENWYGRGIRYLNIILVDNVLAQPLDPELLGYHIDHQADVTIKCTERLNAEEKVGVLVRQNDHVAVVEYSELGEQRGGHFAANLGLFCVNMEFVKKMSSISLPLHVARKDAKFYDPLTKETRQIKAWKFERFIFDMLPFAENVQALLCPRDQCFAPLKNATGPDSPETARKALLKKV